MILDRLFRPRPARVAGQALYAAAVTAARRPALYETLAVPDSAEGRFELYTLHVVLLLDRLRDQGPAATETAQALFDAYLSGLDHALREMGVGDLSVGRKMRKLGEAFYGRVKSYEKAFAVLPDRDALEALLSRTVYSGVNDAPVSRLADDAVAQRAALAENSLEPLLQGQVRWAAI